MKHDFLAEIRTVTATKLVSQDIEIKVTFNTNQSDILDLGKYPADTLFRVSVIPADEADGTRAIQTPYGTLIATETTTTPVDPELNTETPVG